MTKELYYTKIEHVIYMKETYGIRFVVYLSLKESIYNYGGKKLMEWNDVEFFDEVDTLGQAIAHIQALVEEAPPGKIYVHPEDVEKFKPQIGDRIMYSFCGDEDILYAGIVKELVNHLVKGVILENSRRRFEFLTLENASSQGGCTAEISRNGKPFLMPQIENDEVVLQVKKANPPRNIQVNLQVDDTSQR